MKGLSTDLGFVEGGHGILGLRDDMGCLLLKWEGLFNIAFLMRLLMGSLNQTVFLKLLEGTATWRQLPHCGKVIRRSQKVTCLAVFIMPPWSWGW